MEKIFEAHLSYGDSTICTKTGITIGCLESDKDKNTAKISIALPGNSAKIYDAFPGWTLDANINNINYRILTNFNAPGSSRIIIQIWQLDKSNLQR